MPRTTLFQNSSIYNREPIIMNAIFDEYQLPNS